jgi:transcriptional activator SPT8
MCSSSPYANACTVCIALHVSFTDRPDDGYIRDYDIFSAVNGKLFLTAPQRHHCGVVEGLIKGGQIRCWWENPGLFNNPEASMDDPPLAAVYSMITHSDALWTLAGSVVCDPCARTGLAMPNVFFSQVI